MKLPKLKTLLSHKRGYNALSNPDSIYSRSSAAKAGSLGDDEPESKQRGGKEIEDMLGIKNPPQRGVMDARPLKMMDIVMQIWGDDFYYDKEVEDRKDDDEP